MATTVNIVASDTYTNLKAGEPYNSDHYDQHVIATDLGIAYRIDRAGVLQSMYSPVVLTLADTSASFVTMPLLPESPSQIAVYVSGQRLFQVADGTNTEVLSFHIPSGGGQVNFNQTLDEDSLIIEFIP